MHKLLLALAATAGLVAFTPAANAQYFGRTQRDQSDREVRVDRDLRGDRDGRDRDRDGYTRDRRGRDVIAERGPKRNLNDGYDRAFNERRRKSVYIIERGRPVQREVFFDGRRYYRVIDNRPVFIQERVFDSYPERYYHRDGRPRAGVTLNFGG